MGKLLKIIGSLVVAAILLIVITIVILTTTIDPNRYKATISNYVYQQTKHPVVIQGKISWSFFPWLGFEVNRVKVGKLAGQTGDLADVDQLQLKVRAFPLLFGKVEIAKLTVKHAALTITTNQQANPVSSQQDSAKPKSVATVPVQSLNIKALNVTDSTIHIIQAKTHDQLNISKLNISTSDVDMNKNFPIHISFEFTQSGSPNVIRTNINAQAHIDSQKDLLTLTKLSANNTLVRPHLADVPINLDGTLTINPNLQLANLSNAIITIANMQISTKAIIRNFLKVPQYRVELSSRDTDLQKLMTTFTGSSFISGSLNFQAKLTGAGTNQQELVNSLNGSGNFGIKNGEISGININALLAKADAYLNKQPQANDDAPAEKRTQFSAITGSYNINQGVLSNNDLSITSTQTSAQGQGTVNLVQKNMNYKITAKYINKKSTSDSDSLELPILITGTLDHPSVMPDFKTIAQKYLKSEVKDYLKKSSHGLGGLLNGLLNNGGN